MPIHSTDELLWLFAGAFLLGISFGAAYDLLRITRVFFSLYGKDEICLSFCQKLPPFPKRKHNTVRWFSDLIVNLEDLFFLLLCGISISVYLSVAANGILRWLTVLGIILGFLLYYLTVGRLIIFFSKNIADLLRFILLWIAWVIWIPLNCTGTKIKQIIILFRCWCQRAAAILFAPIYVNCVFRQELRMIRRGYIKNVRRNTYESVG